MILWTSIILSCAVGVCMLMLLWMRGRRARILLAGLPSLPPLPFIGNIHQVLISQEYVFYLVKKISSIIEERNLPFLLWFGTIPAVVLIDPADVKTVTNACLDKIFFYKVVPKKLLGNGLITASASRWKLTSKKLGNAFSSSVVAGYQSVFNTHAQKLVKKLQGESEAAPFDVLHKYLNNMTLEAIYQITLGKSDTPEGSITTEYHQAFNRLLQLYVKRALNPLVYWYPVYRLTPACREEEKCTAVVINAAKKAIEKRRTERKESKLNGNINLRKDETERNRFRPLVDLLVELSETDPIFTTDQILDELNTVIAAGHETVAIALSLVLIMVGKNPHIQEKLYTEMKTIFGNSKRPIDLEDLDRMEYCEAVINETLRLYPPVPIFAREVDRDIKLDSCTIPTGSYCVICAWGSGRSARLWGSDAEKFRPERWLEKDSLNNAIILSFNYGKRSCIGKKYTIIFMKTVIGHCIRELIFEGESKELRVSMDVTLNAVEGHLLKVYTRD